MADMQKLNLALGRMETEVIEARMRVTAVLQETSTESAETVGLKLSVAGMEQVLIELTSLLSGTISPHPNIGFGKPSRKHLSSV